MADPDGGRYRAAFAACRSTLEALAQASDESGRMAARAWWTTCMGSNLEACREQYSTWRAEAAAVLPSKLTAAHTETAIGLPGFEPLGQCVLASGAAVGVQPDRTLDHVEAAGEKQQAAQDWSRATHEVEPLRAQLQTTFLKSSGLFSRGKPALAANMEAMGIDELRVCQVWMYGLAWRLRACHERAEAFSREAGMRDPNTPLQGYDESKWDPQSETWQRMEHCVHRTAAKAGAETDSVWRRPLPSKTS